MPSQTVRTPPAAMTEAEVLALPVAVNLATAFRVLDIPTSSGYAAVAAGEFPCRVITVGKTRRVPKAEIMRVLGLTPATDERGGAA